MFKAASFKIHNPSRHLRTMLRRAMDEYHNTLKLVIETALNDPGFPANITAPHKHTGKPKAQQTLLSKYLYRITPKHLHIAPLRDHLVQDASAMLRSYLSKRENGDPMAKPPTLPDLAAPDPAAVQKAVDEFISRIEFDVKPHQAEKIAEARNQNHPRVAHRLENTYRSWAATKAAAQMLRTIEPAHPVPLFTDRSEKSRGFLFTLRNGNYYLLARLFSEKSRYHRRSFALPAMVDVRTGESLEGIKYPGVILPLELGRDHHEREFVAHGKPKSVKLLVRQTPRGDEFFANVSFEFNPDPIKTETFLGIDRGASIIAAATVIDSAGRVLHQDELSGAAFSDEMRRYREWIAFQQSRGIQHHRRFSLRGKRADIILGEFANRLIQTAANYKSQIVVENLDGRAFGRFLKQSQVRRLYDMLAYKAERAGLPRPLEVPAAYTSQTCPNAHRAPENRLTQDLFKCVQRGYTANADRNASHIIALRGMHQVQAARGGRAKFQKFDIFRLWLAEKAGQNGQAARADSHPASPTTFSARDSGREANENG